MGISCICSKEHNFALTAEIMLRLEQLKQNTAYKARIKYHSTLLQSRFTAHHFNILLSTSAHFFFFFYFSHTFTALLHFTAAHIGQPVKQITIV
jgi:hypothetical protein